MKNSPKLDEVRITSRDLEKENLSISYKDVEKVWLKICDTMLKYKDTCGLAVRLKQINPEWKYPVIYVNMPNSLILAQANRYRDGIEFIFWKELYNSDIKLRFYHDSVSVGSLIPEATIMKKIESKHKESKEVSFNDSYCTAEWQRKKNKILERDNYTCQICGDNQGIMQVHHITYRHCNGKAYNAWDSELITLCKDCHKHDDGDHKNFFDGNYYISQGRLMNSKPIIFKKV